MGTMQSPDSAPLRARRTASTARSHQLLEGLLLSDAVVPHPDGRKTRSVRSGSLVDEVRKRILDDIIRCQLRPGTVVQLSSLAQRYSVSRTPVREALAQLQREGLITAVPYKGYFVRPIDVADVHDVFFMRLLLEGAAAELAATRIDPEELARLRRLSPPKVSTMTLEYDRYSYRFHRTIAAASGSRRLLAAFDVVYNDVRRLQYAGIGNPRPDLIHEEHQVIVEALARRDGQEARWLMERHIEAIRARALQPYGGAVKYPKRSSAT